MDVVGVVLDVVVFDDDGFGLDAVVVGFAGFDGAHPGEDDGFGFEAVEAALGFGGGLSLGVGADEVEEGILLRGGEVGVGEAPAFLEFGLALVAGEDVGRGVRGDDGLAFLVGGQKGEEGVGAVFLFGEGAEAFEGSRRDGFGVGPEELGRGGDEAVALEGEVEGEVVALVTPGPGFFGVGGSEEGDGVEVCIAGAVLTFEVVQDGFEGFDVFHLLVSFLTERGTEEGLKFVFLIVVEFGEGDALATEGDEVPVLAFFVGEWELDLFGLFGGQAGEEILGEGADGTVLGLGGDHGGGKGGQKKSAGEVSAGHGASLAGGRQECSTLERGYRL